MTSHAIGLVRKETAGKDPLYWNTEKPHYFCDNKHFLRYVGEGGIFWALRKNGNGPKNTFYTLMMRLNDCKTFEMVSGDKKYGVQGDKNTSIAFEENGEIPAHISDQISIFKNMNEDDKLGSKLNTVRELNEDDFEILTNYSKTLRTKNSFKNYDTDEIIRTNNFINPEYTYREEEEIERQIIADKSLDATVKQRLIDSRVGQGKYRENVMKFEEVCRITKIQDHKLLIASHIKPWSKCETAEERLDGENGLLLAPHIDKLFDLFLISFRQNGELLISPHLENATLVRLGLLDVRGKKFGKFSDRQEFYLAQHRQRFFELSEKK